MIIRILEDGVYKVPDDFKDQLELLDEELEKSVTEGDEEHFAELLGLIIKEIRSIGDKLSSEDFATSDLIVPSEHSKIKDVKMLIDED